MKNRPDYLETFPATTWVVGGPDDFPEGGLEQLDDLPDEDTEDVKAIIAADEARESETAGVRSE